MAEITAVGVYMQFWFPDVPQWIPALAALVCMTTVNLIAVEVYGEFEFWFALIKVFTIAIMIVVGLGMIIFGIGNNGIPIGISNLWAYDGFCAKGLTGMIMSLVMVMFAYLGIELVGVTAGEAKDPEKTLPAAIDKVFWRILIFYIGALFVIMSLYPWNQLGTIGSPFVLTFEKLGIRAAAGIINFVVLTAALSSCNSGIFSTSRMVYSLAQENNAHESMKKLNSHQVPVNATFFSATVILISVILNYIMPEGVFVLITSISTFCFIFIWAVMVICHLKYRKTNPELADKSKFKMPFYPIANYVILAFLA
jgi:L-asparagine transporter-like permease